MKIDNFKDIKFDFENVTSTVIDSSEIKDFEIAPFEYLINGEKVYLATIRMNSTITNFRNIPEDIDKPWPKEHGENYYLNPARRIYLYDDITEIVIHKNDGYIQKLVPYWGDFNIDERSLYQKSTYETELVEGKLELTGDLILEVYVKEMSDLLSKKLDTCNAYKSIINEMLVDSNPLCFKGDKTTLTNTYCHDAWMLAQEFIENKIKNEEDTYNKLYETIYDDWEDYSKRYKTQINDVSKKIYKRINNTKYCNEWEEFDY